METYKRRAALRKKMREDAFRLAVLLLMTGIVASAVAAYNMSNIYLLGRNNATVYVPDVLTSGMDNLLLVMTTDAEGRPLADRYVSVDLIFNDSIERVYGGTTDKNGTSRAIVSIPHTTGWGTIAIKAGTEKITKKVYLDGTLKIHLSTDKPIYQPEQTIHIRTLTFEGEKATASAKNVTIEIQSPEGDRIFRKNLGPNEFGIASLDYPLSDQLPLGPYKIVATVGQESVQKSVLVKNYVLPKFSVELKGIKGWYTLDENIEGTVSCMYFFGKEVKGSVSIEAKSYFGIWETIAVINGTLVSGLFPFSIPPIRYSVGVDVNDGNGYLELNVTVTDEAGHKEEKSRILSVSPSPITVTALADVNMRSVDSTYYIVARYPDGRPVRNAEIRYSIDEGYLLTSTDERGVAVLTFEYRGQSRLTVTASKDGFTSTAYFDLKESKGIKILSDKAHYGLLEKARFEVFYSGDSFTNLAYYDVVGRGFVIKTGSLELENGRGFFELTTSSDMIPLAQVRVYKTQKNLEVVRDSAIIGVGSLESLRVQVQSDKEIYRPHEDVNLEFNVTKEGAPVVSALGVSIVDLAVFEVNERFLGLEQVFLGLEEEFVTPSYQMIDYVFSERAAPIPVDAPKEIEMTSGQEGVMISTWPFNVQKAAEIQATSIDSFWSFLALSGVAGYFGLIVLGMKYKILAILAATIAIIIAPAIIVYTFTTSLLSPMEGGAAPAGGGEPIFLGGEWREGGINVDMTAFGSEAGGLPSAESAQIAKPVRVRQFFPETWYWSPTIITDESGKAILSLVTPDSITSWGVEAMASTKDAQFGLGSKNITVFQDFFIEPDIPVSAVQNDTFPLRVLIYNYLSERNDVVVQLQNASWFELLDSSEKLVGVEANSVTSVSFMIKATQIGRHEISVFAGNAKISDMVIREIRIEPNGKKVEEVINGRLDGNASATHLLSLDAKQILGSENAFVKIQGDMRAIVLDGAEGYISFVSGCGEQSMSTLSVDILAFDIVKRSGGTEEKLFEYENIVSQGIQHELTFLVGAKNGIGRGIVWFPGDEDVHPWLTSWGLVTFQDAINAGFDLDNKIIEDMQSWLVSQQNSDGSYDFPEWGLYEYTNPILRAKIVATTAYVTRALVYSGYPVDSNPVQKALSYVEQKIKEHWQDPYTLALALIVLEDARGSQSLRNEVANQLISLRREENETAYWESDSSFLSSGGFQDWRLGGYGGRRVETTGYAIMALYKYEGYSSIVSKGVKYLLSQRSGMGGFFATQDTVVAFQALKLVAGGEVDIEDITVDVTANGQLASSIHFTPQNENLTYFVDLRSYISASTEVRIESRGKGSILYQIYFSQYLPWVWIPKETPELFLHVTYDATTIVVNDYLQAHLQLQYNGPAQLIKMILIDLRSPVGFSFVPEDFEILLEGGTINRYEIKDRQAMIYIQNILQNQMVKFDYRLHANMPIKGTIQGVNAFDLYDPALSTTLDPVEIIASP